MTKLVTGKVVETSQPPMMVARTGCRLLVGMHKRGHNLGTHCCSQYCIRAHVLAGIGFHVCLFLAASGHACVRCFIVVRVQAYGECLWIICKGRVG